MCCNYLSTMFRRLCSIWSTLGIPLSFRHPDTCTLYTDDESLFLLRSLRWRRPPQPLREETRDIHHDKFVNEAHIIASRCLFTESSRDHSFLEHRGNGKQYETTFRFGATYKAEPLYFRFRTVLLLWRWHEAVSRSAEPPTPTEWSQENSSFFLTRTQFFSLLAVSSGVQSQQINESRHGAINLHQITFWHWIESLVALAWGWVREGKEHYGKLDESQPRSSRWFVEVNARVWVAHPHCTLGSLRIIYERKLLLGVGVTCV